MFANLLHLFTRRTPAEDYDLAFVETVSVRPPREARSRRSERWLIVGWLLIALKCVGVWWLIRAYHVPIHPAWLIGPTLMFAGMCTAVYIWRN